jgi:predicted permease
MRGIRRIFRLPVEGPRDADDDVDEEIAFHLAMREATLRARGHSPQDASRLARNRFGNVDGIRAECVREYRSQTRTERVMQMLEEARRDAGFAVRSLWRAKTFSIAVILTLALGIGANATIFAVIEAVIMRPVAGVRDPGELFELGDALSYPAYRALHERLPALGLAAVSERRMALGTGAATDHTVGAMVSGNFFGTVGARAAIGRLLTAGDDTPGAPPVGVLAHAYWTRSLGSDSSIVGRTITANGAPITIVGVLAGDFRGMHLGEFPDVWMPIHAWPVIAPSMGSSSIESTGWEWLRIIGRAAPGTPSSQLRRDIGAVLRENPDVRQEVIDQIATARPMQAAALSSGSRETVVRFSTILAVVVALVLLTACANIAGLLLARAAYREREIAVRIALGAGRGRLVRQLLTEAFVLAGIGGIIGLAGFAAVRLMLRGATLPGGIPGSSLALQLDMRVIGFAVLVTIVTGLLFGLMPALQASRPDTVSAIRGTSVVRGSRSQLLRGMLVAAQVAVGVVLLAGTGLFARALTRAFAVDLGFRTENLLSITVDPSLAQLDPPRAAAYVADVTARVAAIPGVRGVTWTDSPILTVDFNRYGAKISGYTPAPDERIRIETSVVGPRYHEVVGIGMVSGRGFEASDAAGAPPVVIVNETLARRYFADREVLGNTITMADKTVHIIGVARDAKYHGLNENPRPYAYIPMLQLPAGSVGVATLVARTASDPGPMVRPIVEAARASNRGVPVFAATTLSDHLRVVLAPQVAGAWLLGVFSALALVVAAVGIHGVVAYSVSRRTREIGIRMALGARAPTVLRLVMGGNLAFIALGIPVGVGLALVLARATTGFLFGVGPTDTLTFAGTAGLMVVIGVLASYIPARRAVRIDPLVALRTDD